MTREEKIETIADILEIDVEDVQEETLLEDIETWDSVAVLSLIAVINEQFDRFPLAEELTGLKTIKDLMDTLE